jgi:hypothetical protein
MEPGPLFMDPGPLFSEPGPRLSARTGSSSAMLRIWPIAGDVSKDSPAIVPSMISFQLLLFIIELLFKNPTVDRFYLTN